MMRLPKQLSPHAINENYDKGLASVPDHHVAETLIPDKVWPACAKPPPSPHRATTAGMMISASITMQPWTKSVRQTARKPLTTLLVYADDASASARHCLIAPLKAVEKSYARNQTTEAV